MELYTKLGSIECLELNYRLLDNKYNPSPYFNLYTYSYYKPCGYVIDPSETELNNLSKSSDVLNYFEKNHGTINDKSVLYITKNCKIPRLKIKEKFKRTIKEEKATLQVIPRISTNTIELKTYYVFQLEAYYYIIDSSYFNISDTYIGKPLKEIISQKILDTLYGSKRSDDYLLCLDAEYIGSRKIIINTPRNAAAKDAFIFLLKKSCNTKFIYEDEVMTLLGNQSNKIDKDTINSIVDLLESSDQGTNILGLQTLAELDYANYPNIVQFILINYENVIDRIKSKCSTSVKYMLYELLSHDGYLRKQDIKDVEVEILETLYNKKLKQKIAVLLENRLSNNLFNINLDIQIKLDRVKENERPTCNINFID